MFDEVQEADEKIDLSSTQSMHLQEVAETIRDDSLRRAYSMLPPLQRDLELQQLLQRADFLNAFKRYMAQGIANVIGATDKRVQALYLFEESMNPDAETEDYLPLDATIHLLVLVKSNSAALEAFIASLDRAITQQVCQLPSPLLRNRSTILDIIPVTEEDVEEGRGYASLLKSLFAPPTKIWTKEGQ